MTKTRWGLIIMLGLTGLISAQTVSDFDHLYRYYGNSYLKRINRFYIKNGNFGISGNANSNFFMHPNIVESDHSLSLSASLRGAYLFRHRVLFEFIPTLSYVNHFDHPEYSYLNRALTSNLYVKLWHRMLWQCAYTVSRNRWRIYDTFGELVIRTANILKTRLAYETARKTALFLEAGLIKNKISGDLFNDENTLDDRFNQETLNLGCGVEYRLTAKTTASLAANIYFTEFPNYLRQDHRGIQVQVGIRFPKVGTEEGRISGRVLFGLKTYDLDEYDKHFLTWIADTDLVVARGRWRWNVRVGRDFDFAVFQVSPLVHTTVFVGVDYYWSKRFFLGAGFRYHHLDYRVPLIVDWGRTLVTAVATSPVLTFGLRALNKLWLTLTWSQFDWTSDRYYYYNKHNNVFSFGIVKRF